MIKQNLQQDGHIIYYLDGLWSRVVVATFDTPERAAAWLDAWQEHAALEAERDALAERLARVEAVATALEKQAAAATESFNSDVENGEEYWKHASPWYTAAFCGEHAQALRAALADPDPAPDAHTTLAAEMADFRALYDALKWCELKLDGWDELRRADPAPEHAGTRAALDEIRADQEQQAVHSALIAGITELHEWNEARRADPAPDAAADDAALDELRQSWWPRLDAVLDALSVDEFADELDSADIKRLARRQTSSINIGRLLDDISEGMGASDANEDAPLAPGPTHTKVVRTDLRVEHRKPSPPNIGDYDVEIDPHDDEGRAHKTTFATLAQVARLIPRWEQYVTEIDGSTGEVEGVERCIEDLSATLTGIPAPTFDHQTLSINYEEAKAFVDGVVADLKARRAAALEVAAKYWRGEDENGAQ